jgi:uncharacterized membrane protein YedE/YeeE
MMIREHASEASAPGSKYWNPYLAGVAMGLVLLSAYLFVGKGLGASGPALRVAGAAIGAVAPGHVAHTPALAKLGHDGNPLENYFVFLGLGTLLGGVVAAYSSGRLQPGVTRGPTAGTALRLSLALAGGVLLGVGARLARGCASGQALTGGALLSAGSWAFMFAIFGGGYAAAYFVRRQWR